jgi:glycosyltransferase involved in cell wall biosynthesis
MKKPKILMCSEASYLSSGYATYAKEILTRLFKTNKYEIAEFASYGLIGDHRDKYIPWKYYPNAIHAQDPRQAEYNSAGDNVFGKWRFDRVVLDFQPDIVFDIRDFWMNAYQKYSSLRPYFRWLVMPTVDSYPQQEEWLDVYMNADGVLSYTDWGGNVLNQQTNNNINYFGSAPPGVDLEAFKPLDKDTIRKQLGINPQAKIIGTVMRNQKRKLLPDLFYSLRLLLDAYEQTDPENGKDLYLYVHTTYPDAGWNIPALLKENSVAKRVLFTYICKNCRKTHAHTFNHVIKHCPFCKKKTAVFPSVTDGVSTSQLGEIYNSFDLYIQYAICEGFGMPQVEAGACGVPIASVDYSAMSDIVRNLDGFVIPPDRFFKELETEAYRCYPNNGILIKTVLDFFKLSPEQRLEKSSQTRKLTEDQYTWDKTALAWENVFDEAMKQPTKLSWSSVDKAYKQEINIDSLSQFNNAFNAMKFICDKSLSEDDLYNMRMLNILKNSDYGYVLDGFTTKPYSMQDALKTINRQIENKNLIKYAVANTGAINPEDYITYANNRNQNL